MTIIARHELYDPLFHTPREDLYEVYRRMRDDHPIYRSECRDVWCLTRFEDVQAAARDWKTFSNANGVDLDTPPQFFGPGTILEEDPPRHDVLRKVVRPFFVPKRIAALETDIALHVEELTRRLAGAGRIDLAQDFAWALPVWMICRLLGVPPADDELVHGLVVELETRHPGDDLQSSGHKLVALRQLQRYAEELAAQKRQAPGDDLMSHLVASEAKGELRGEEIPGMTVLLFAAGTETTASLIGNALFLLAEHRDAQKELRRTPVDLVDAAIEESLRMESPVQYLARQSTTSMRIHDVEVPKGADVILIYGAANRDERRFERAETFDIHRPAQRHLAFGEGIHFCLGAPLARLEARIALPAFLRAIPSYEIETPAERMPRHTVRGFARLPAVIG
ncbi:MAG: cytochrome P450 [Solirubrobacteraceae bacterium]